MQEFQFSQPQSTPSMTNLDDAARVFNTALIATHAPSTAGLHDQLTELMRSPSFMAILSAVRSLAQSEGVTETKASEMIIETFRKADRAWSDYVFQEGVARLRGSGF